MDLVILHEIMETLGALMVAFTAIKVHHRVLKEHKIDEHVYSEMRQEQIVGLLGMALIIGGFVIKASLWM